MSLIVAHDTVNGDLEANVTDFFLTKSKVPLNSPQLLMGNQLGKNDAKTKMVVSLLLVWLAVGGKLIQIWKVTQQSQSLVLVPKRPVENPKSEHHRFQCVLAF